jgi:hypothetical protein
VAAKERVLDLLTEKRRALITRAITRGLDPRAPVRGSGIAWLGEIPAHWEIERARWLFRERDQRSETGEEELLTVSHLTGVTPRSEKDVNMFEAETTEGYKICLAGDLVINTLWAWMGAMGVSRSTDRQPGLQRLSTRRAARTELRRCPGACPFSHRRLLVTPRACGLPGYACIQKASRSSFQCLLSEQREIVNHTAKETEAGRTGGD